MIKLNSKQFKNPITGTFEGIFSGNGEGVTGVVTASYSVTSSYASNAELLDGKDSLYFTSTGSFNSFTSSYYQDSASFSSSISSNKDNIQLLSTYTGSYTTTGSNTFNGNQTISGSLNVIGSDYTNTSASFDTRILENSASITLLSGSYLFSSGGFSTRISTLENFSSSLDATFASVDQLNSATASLSSSIGALSSSYLQTSQSFNSFKASYNTASFTGSYTGDGGGLYNIPASGIVGLNLNAIVSGSVSASISPDNGLQINTNVNAPSFTGSLYGTASLAISASYYQETDPIFVALSGSFATTGSNTFQGTQTITGSNGRLIYTGTTLGLYPTLAEIHANDDYPWLERFYNDTFSTSSAIMAYFGWSDGRFVFHNESTQSIGLQVNGFNAENGLLVYPDKVAFVNNVEVTGSLNVVGGITGSLFGTASFATLAHTASYVLQAVSSSYAATASYVANASSFPFTGSAIITGSLTVTGSVTATQGFTGSLFGTASFATTASYTQNALSASYALTASYLDNYIPPFPFTGSAVITGSLIVTGSVSATSFIGDGSQLTGIQRTRQFDYSGSYSYQGSAPSGSSVSTSVWDIYRIEIFISGTVDTKFASNAIWADRYTTIYS
jgi:hypothetical protein